MQFTAAFEALLLHMQSWKLHQQLTCALLHVRSVLVEAIAIHAGSVHKAERVGVAMPEFPHNGALINDTAA